MSKMAACDICVHGAICKHKRLYLQALNAAKHTIIYDADVPGEIKSLRIAELEFISDVNLVCKFYQGS